MMRMLILAFVFFAGCAEMRPDSGRGWGYSYKRIAPDTYHIHVSGNRFTSTGDAENLFRKASNKVAELNHCRDYKVETYSTYIDNTLYGAGDPEIDGNIICLR